MAPQDRSYRIADFPHFKDQKLSSALSVSFVPPKADEKGYTKDGGFFFTIRGLEDTKSTFLSEQEAALLAARLQAVLNTSTKKVLQLEAARPQQQPQRAPDAAPEYEDSPF